MMGRVESRVTIAIPVYNGAEHLQQAIESALAQTVSADVCVFDNASTDDSADLARSLLGDDAVVLAGENMGAVENFNRAVRESVDEFFAWLAHDDWLMPEYVERCLRVLDEHPDAPACLPGVQFTDSHGNPTRILANEDLASPDPRLRLRSYLRCRRWTEVYCLYRRTWLERSPLFTDGHGADVLLTWWFLLRGPLAVAPEPLLAYREYPLASVRQATDKATGAAPAVRWKMARMWRRLWAMTRDGDVDQAVARAARRELLLMVTWPGVVFWVADDVLDRWPGVDRLLRRGWEKVGAPGRIAPTPLGCASQDDAL